MTTMAECKRRRDDEGAFEWHPGSILQGRNHACWAEFALVALNQPLNDVYVLPALWANSCLRVAADGGANRLVEAMSDFSRGNKRNDHVFDNLDVIIGDLDSLSDETENYYRFSVPKPPEIIRDPDQYSTDFGKAVSHIRRLKPSIDIVAMGGLGGRVDQGISQLHHLYLFQADREYNDGRMYLLSGESLTFILKTGKHKIWVRGGDGEEMFGKHVGIVPIKEPSVITTKGLEWDVTDWKTEIGGQISTSNHVLPHTKVVEVETNKDVVFTIALRS